MLAINKASRRVVVACGIALGGIASLDLAPRVDAADETPAAGKAKPNGTAAPQDKTIKGWFVSFEDGMLAIQNRQVRILAKIPENATTLLWNHDAGRYQPVDTAEAMRQLAAPINELGPSLVDTEETMVWRKAGTGLNVQIAGDNVTIRIGESKIPFVGNLVSFKDDTLLFRLNNPQVKKSYGDAVRFRMNETIPVYESIDGGEYKWVGTPRSFLGSVKEGTVITVFHNYKTETDEFYLVLVGVKKKN